MHRWRVVPEPDEGGGTAAYQRAQRVVGLYGDPDSTWGIGLDLELGSPAARPASAPDLDEMAAALVATFPHLGPAVEVEKVEAAGWDAVRSRLVCGAYRADQALVRVAVTPDQERLLVAAHHGVCDGLGLVAIASLLQGVPVRSLASGIGERTAGRGFVRQSLIRMGEAGFRPPHRFPAREAQPAVVAGVGEGTPEQEHLLSLDLPRQRGGTTALCSAIVGTFVDHGGRGRPLVIIGASRRSPGVLTPDRQTAYLRLRLDRRGTAATVGRQMAKALPEPDFPETSWGGMGPRLTHLARNRLGATALVSNLGVLEGAGLRRAHMYPAVSGPRAVVVGLVSTSRLTSVTLRTRSSEFGLEETQSLLEQITAAYGGPQ